ncbi:XRE family transcriptional regulator [Paenibacillus amylolyticus]|uniref:helix-turn-helix domain-containing protein n=1 Tax=Paenibacillus amylolyticus TaxID=1451 RepID=UPI0010595725|nr:helix-turn-helix transcriptional regulator [Paenibacillus amylolyticus]TDL70429.1 XRE family transcriptional regulator [Paenibacillus amylolyticus]
MESLGERINYLRVARRGITMEQLANQLAIPVYDKDKIIDHKPVTSGTISNLENNKHRPNVDLMVVIAKYFNVSLDWLVNGQEFEGEKNPSLSQLKLKDLFASMSPEELEMQAHFINEMRMKTLGNSE